MHAVNVAALLLPDPEAALDAPPPLDEDALLPQAASTSAIAEILAVMATACVRRNAINPPYEPHT
jgi:hypothetical protein